MTLSQRISLSNVVVAEEAPDYLQHLVTDLNGIIARLNAVLTEIQTEINDNAGAYGG